MAATKRRRTRPSTPPPPSAGTGDAYLQSVVRVTAVSDEPDYEQPWQTRGPMPVSGSGVIVRTKKGLRVLTNAHVVQNQMFIEVLRHGQSKKFRAHVEGAGHECDLAVLSVDDPSFFRGAKPIPLGTKLPPLSTPVQVLGFPIGGERLSVTQGVLSRIEMTPYAQSQRRLLAAQIDAAINSGNSGGPVMYRGRLIGIAFQGLEEGENIGYMIAVSVVRHFLKDLDDGTFEGFPDLGTLVQTLESSAHRKMLGLPARRSGGVLVLNVGYESSAWGQLKPGDVILKVDGVPVAADGTVAFEHGARIEFSYVISKRHVGDEIPVEVWRQKRSHTVLIKLHPPRYLVSEDRYDVKPTYYLFGGLLFVPLSRDYLKTWGSNWWNNAPHGLMDRYERGCRSPERREVVVLQKVLADEVNQGLHELESLEIESVQGVAIRDLRHLIQLIESDDKEFIHLVGSDLTHIVIEREPALQRGPMILERFGVPHDRSEDLRPRPLQPARGRPATKKRPDRARVIPPRAIAAARGRQARRPSRAPISRSESP